MPSQNSVSYQQQPSDFPMPLSATSITQALDIIERHTGETCDARKLGLDDYFLNDKWYPKEYRLNTRKLGFGGKLRQSNANSRLYVSVYSEDETPEVLRIRDAINADLANLT